MPQRDAAARATSARDPRSALPPATGADGGPPAPRRPGPAAHRDAGATAVAESFDARDHARASLAAGRSPSLWWVCTGIVAVLVVSFAVGAPEGAVVLASLLAVSAVARGVLRPGPVALTVRSRVLDTALLAGLAVAVGVLSQIAPMR
jgi:hypothetical protein